MGSESMKEMGGNRRVEEGVLLNGRMRERNRRRRFPCCEFVNETCFFTALQD
jgi:hypothetical protein